ncbi:MAG: TolC family protein [Bacteroidaceae bacterium]|nr:TolC family protein [Bacteroidaceae bacterium]MBQ8455724.1 TolC family protein [Bacteroidaceae bacterium]MBQ9169737.1 TolC family protein [Bacteroidaceae bacterium]MBQ9295000.1 TolC family protein [Bacteroidaceae bacterium]
MKSHIFYILMLVSMSVSAQKLTLEQCLERARTYNHELRNAVLETEAASMQKKEAFTNYFPRISANVMAFRMFDEMVKADGTYPQEIAALSEQFIPLIGQPFSVSEFNRAYAISATLIQPLFHGGQIVNGNKLARVQEDVMALKHQLTEKEVVQKVTECYWQLAQVRYNMSTLDAAEKQVEAVMEQVENFLRAGVTTRNSLLKVRLRQQELSSNRLKLENADHVLRLLLAQQIGIEPALADKDFDIVLEDKTLEQPIEAVAGQLGLSPDHREELQLLGKAVEAQELQVKMERGKYLPHLAVGLAGYHTGLGGFSDGVKSYMHTNMNNGLVFGTLAIPISDWWGGNYAMKRQKIKLQQAQNDRENARQMLQIDIERAWTNLQEAYKQTQIAQASCDEAAENLRMSTDQYRMSTCTLTDLLDAETLNRQAQNNLAQAKANYQIALADYRRKAQ